MKFGKGVNFGPTQFATQYTPVSRQFRASNRQPKVKLMKKFHGIVVSDRAKYGLICS